MEELEVRGEGNEIHKNKENSNEKICSYYSKQNEGGIQLNVDECKKKLYKEKFFMLFDLRNR